MKTILILLLTCCTWFVHAQVESVKPSKWSVGIVFSPQYAYRFLSSDNTNQWMVDMYDTLEKPKYGYSSGVMVDYHLGKRTSVSGGLLFSDKGERIDEVATLRNYKNHYYFIDVPLQVNYNLYNKNLKIYVTTGLNAAVFLANRTTYFEQNSLQEEHFSNSVKLAQLHLGGLVGLGLSSPISSKVDFKLTFLYRQSLTKVMDSPLKRYFYSVGADMGLYYNF